MLNLQLWNLISVVWINPMLQATDRASSKSRKAPLFHLHSWCDTRPQVAPFPSSSLCLFAVLHPPKQHSAWHKAKFWAGTAACVLCLHFQLYLLLQRTLCWVLLPGWWLPMLPGDESQIFLCTRERGMCWRLHFPRKRCTVQLLFYKIKQL